MVSLARIDIIIRVYTGRTRSGADFLGLVAWRCAFELLTDHIRAGNARVCDRSRITKVGVDADKGCGTTGSGHAVNLNMTLTLLQGVSFVCVEGGLRYEEGMGGNREKNGLTVLQLPHERYSLPKSST